MFESTDTTSKSAVGRTVWNVIIVATFTVAVVVAEGKELRVTHGDQAPWWEPSVQYVEGKVDPCFRDRQGLSRYVSNGSPDPESQVFGTITLTSSGYALALFA